MAGKSNTFENEFLRLIFNNVSIQGIGNASGIPGSTVSGSLYVSLHTGDPGEAGLQNTNEANYTNYRRVEVVRSTSGWTVTGNVVRPTSNIVFGTCTGGESTISHFAVGTSETGPGKILFFGTTSPVIKITEGITPQLTTATVIVED